MSRDAITNPMWEKDPDTSFRLMRYGAGIFRGVDVGADEMSYRASVRRGVLASQGLKRGNKRLDIGSRKTRCGDKDPRED